MPRLHSETIDALAALPALPDYAVLTKSQTCAVTNLSADTLDRLHRLNQGPPRVQLSPRRVGYPAGALRAWLIRRPSRSTAFRTTPNAERPRRRGRSATSLTQQGRINCLAALI